MFDALFPTYESKSAYRISWKKAYDAGIRAVLFDIDNTLVPHGAPADARAKALFVSLRELGFSTCLISNNGKERVIPFAEAVKSPCLYHAHKPSADPYKQAMEMLGTNPSSTLFVGDQLLTDIWGANRAGIPSVYAGKIHPREPFHIVLKRLLEQIILYFYRRKS